MPDLIRLRDLRAGDREHVGAKAANLGELLTLGLPVPTGFCLPIAVYTRVVGPITDRYLARLGEVLARGDQGCELEPLTASLRAEIEQIELDEPLRAELAGLLGELGAEGRRFAVRSSATFEDSPQASFAGQYDSELNVPADRVPAAIRQCWASLWRHHAVRYRQRQAIEQSAVGMAVIVQVMAEAQFAGVLFTADPRNGSRDSLIIESVQGYGEALVSGMATPDRFAVSRAGAIENLTDQGKGPSLTLEQVRELARVGRTIEEHVGAPQDVEWAISGGHLALLQTRPVTHVAAPGPQAHWESPVEGAWWARISICDSWLPEPLSPLFATTLFPRLVRRWQRNWAGPERVQHRNPLIPRPMSCTINGFAYLRFDYHLNSHPVRAAELVLRWCRFHFSPLRRRWRDRIMPRHVERLATLRAQDPAGMSGAELLEVIVEAEELSAEYWAVIGGLAWYWNTAEWLLGTVYRWVARSAAAAGLPPSPGALLQGYPSRTLDADIELADLARGELDGQRFTEFLDRYGHQVYNLDFLEPAPADEPASFHAAMAAYRTGVSRQPRDRQQELVRRRDTQMAAVRSALRRSPVRRLALMASLRLCRRQGRLRDEVLFHFTLGWPVIRRGYLELGRRLVAAGALSNAEEVFYLTGEELKGWVLSGAPVRYHDLAAQRTDSRESQRRLSPPMLVPQDTRMYLGKRDITALAVFGQDSSTVDGDARLHGSAVSPGRVTAPARRISSVQDFSKFQPGEVLIAPYLTPAWSSLLAIAAGVVTDMGGLLSHGSIVAREYGVPAVMGTREATRVIDDGQLVTVDGDRGLVF